MTFEKPPHELSFSAMTCPVKYIEDMERSGFNWGAGKGLHIQIYK
jgi:hypothetical protein